MRRKLVYICSAFIVGVLAFTFSSCRPGNQTVNGGRNGGGPIILPAPAPDDSTGRNRTRTRVGGGSCERDDDCEEQCEDLFGSRTKREDCLELSVNEVEGMFLAFEDNDGYLAEPDEDDLPEVQPEDIENALDIDGGLWGELIEDYSRSQAKRVLYWIATEGDIYDAIDSSFDDGDLKRFFNDLLDEFGSNSFIDFITTTLDRDKEDNFVVLSFNADEDSGASFLLEEALDDCRENAPAGQQTSKYTHVDEDFRDAACLLAEALCDEDKGDYIFRDVFEYILEEIVDLEDYIRAGSASSTHATTHRDGLEVDDYEDINDVCRAADNQGLI